MASRMTGTAQVNTAPVLPVLDLPRLDPGRQVRAKWFARIVSLLLLGIVALQAGEFNAAQLAASWPTHIAFWPVFLMMYCTLPLADWIIFRRLWRLPVDGIAAILRKRISNELLLSYSGEVYFYFWARQRAGLTAAPFGAIKDVNILSALIANLVTLALLGLAYPYITELHPGQLDQIIPISVAVILAISIIAFLVRGRLFTLDPRDLVWVSGVHLMRILTTTALLALVWHLAMPQVPLVLWLELSALRLVVSRLPLLPAKDLLFTTIAIFLLGTDNQVSALLAMTAALTLALHLVLAVVFAVTGLFEKKEKTA